MLSNSFKGTIFFWSRKVFAVALPQYSSRAGLTWPVTLIWFVWIWKSSYGNCQSKNLSMMWAHCSAFLRRPTLMFVSLACDARCKSLRANKWWTMYHFNTCKTSAWVWVIESGWWGLFPCLTLPKLSLFSNITGYGPTLSWTAVFKMSCGSIAPNISPQWLPAAGDFYAMVHLHKDPETVHRIITAAEQICGETSRM